MKQPKFRQLGLVLFLFLLSGSARPEAAKELIEQPLQVQVQAME